jgi:iron complex outermembrane receptor protein
VTIHSCKTALLASASALGVALALGAAGQAYAADADVAAAAGAAPDVTQVTITAERRTNIQQTAIAVTAVTSSVLDQTAAVAISDLNASVPSLEITRTAASENLVTIRGIGSETPENSSSTSPGVSYFVDGVYIANSISLDESLFDVDQIQVLRGPQGDLYGESSIGGAIVVNTKQPVLHNYSGSGDFSAGNYNYFRERAEVNLPVGDDVAVRMSIQKNDHDGWTKDTYFTNFYEDDQHDFSGKIAVLWKPTDFFTGTITGEWYRATEHGASQKNVIELEPYSEVLANNPNAPAVSPLSTNPRTIYQDFQGQFDLTSQLYHMNLDYIAPWFEVKSVTGYQHFFHVQREDSSRSAYNILGSYDDVPGWNDDITNYTQEIDLVSKPGGPLDWTAGVFALNREAVSTTAEFETASGCKASNPETTPSLITYTSSISTTTPFPCNLAYGNITTDTKQGAAAFLRLTYHITPQLSVTAGGRYNWDRSSHDSNNFSEFDTTNEFASDAVTGSTPTGLIKAQYEITPDNFVYASVSRGYKPGGANGSPCNPATSQCPQVVKNTFLPETNTAYEVGSKNQFFDHTLTLDAAFYYYDHYNFQYIEQDPIPFDDGMSNIPHIRDYGAEFEGHYHSSDYHFHMDGSLALEKGEVVGKYLTIDSTLTNQFEGPNNTGNNELATFGPCAFSGGYYNPKCWAQVEAAAINIQGKSPPAMPNVSGAISASYDFDTTYGTFTPWIQYVYRGQEWARIFNDPTYDNVPAYGVLNLNVAYVPSWSKMWKVSLAATNVTNVAGINSKYTDPYGTAQTSIQYIAPMQVIGTIAVTF